ncbi:hypothetical protein HK405_012171, partial [Cladochytrium tenue]
MSGGVDSTVAAHLLQSQGLRVRPVFMRNWDPRDEDAAHCPSAAELAAVRRACSHLDITNAPPTSTAAAAHDAVAVVDLAREYWTDVFEPCLRDLQEGGRTPNPDVACNRHVKFGAFADRLLRRGDDGDGEDRRCDWIAMGHYARVEWVDGTPRLMKGRLDQ